jgi:archaemetzincin
MNIYIAPVKFSNTALADNIIIQTAKLFNNFFEGSKVQKINLSINIETAYSKERAQYFSTQIIAEAIKHTGDINGKVLLLTEYDLYIPVLTFVFGEAQLKGKHSIVSVCRLHEEFYSEISNDNLLFKRTMKEVLHELGHNFGLKHCTDWDCVMHSSPGIEEVDIKGGTYCSSCLDKVRN